MIESTKQKDPKYLSLKVSEKLYERIPLMQSQLHGKRAQDKKNHERTNLLQMPPFGPTKGTCNVP